MNLSNETQDSLDDRREQEVNERYERAIKALRAREYTEESLLNLANKLGGK